MSVTQINKKASGIYKIYCVANDKTYIGQSKSMSKRLARHKNELNKDIHPNRLLQDDWNKYGAKSFLFLPIENCSSEFLTEREVFNLLQIPIEKRFNLGVIDKFKV